MSDYFQTGEEKATIARQQNNVSLLGVREAAIKDIEATVSAAQADGRISSTEQSRIDRRQKNITKTETQLRRGGFAVDKPYVNPTQRKTEAPEQKTGCDSDWSGGTGVGGTTVEKTYYVVINGALYTQKFICSGEPTAV